MAEINTFINENKNRLKIVLSVFVFVFSFFLLPKFSFAAVTLQRAPSFNLGLVGYWSFNGSDYNAASTTAEVLDRSGQGNNGDAIGGVGLTAGKIGQALSFDGTDDYVNVADPASGVLDFGTATNFTLSAWVNIPSSDPGVTFFSKNEFSNAPPGFVFLHSNFADSSYTVRVTLDTASGFCVVRGTTNIADNKWHHVTGVVFRRASCTTSDILIYVDGVLQSGDVVLNVDNTNADISSSEPLRIGGGEDGGALFFDQQKIDEVRIHNRALSAGEVKQLYQSGAAKLAASSADLDDNSTLGQGLVGHWTLDGVDTNWGSNTTLDRSGSGNTGTLTNMSTTTSPTPGKIGQGLSFNASNDNVNAGDISLTDSQTTITWSFWLNQNLYQSGDCYLTKSDPNGLTQMSWEICNEPTSWLGNEDDIMVHISTALNSSDYISATCYPQDFNINLNEWMQITVVYDGNQTGNTNRLKIYKNGTQISFAGGECSGTIPASTTNSSSAVVIGDSSDGTRNINAKMDDVRIYNRALSAAEISKLYQVGAAKVNSSQNITGGSLDQGLVGLWSFNGPDYNAASTTAEVLDRSGQGNNGDAQNGPTRTIGKLGQGLRFDGVDDRVDLGTDSIDTNTVTLCAWFNTSVLDQFKAIFSNARFYFGLYSANSTLQLDSNTNLGSSVIANTGILSTNTWYHTCAVRNSGANGPGTIYLNGVSVGSGNSDTPTTGFGLSIGDDQFTEYQWNGKLDDVRIYNRVLSMSEIIQLYNMGR